ncbi:MAG TPA: Gfo/Idh/MocA family oxidoreductase [Pirellulales bacterium]|nr:Gfo/Idh/MocA family oxidoreductase [Pirellulales bacterium]
MLRRSILAASMVLLASAALADETTVRVGIIGLDTSHVSAFTGVLNRPGNEGELAGVKVVAAFPGGSSDIAASRDRVEGFTNELHDKYGVEIVDSIEKLLTKVDAVLLESVDGRPHVEQARPVLAAKKPLFIDKPVAASLADAMEIYRLSEATGTPCFSSSSLRFSSGIKGMRSNEKVGEVLGCDAYGPCSLEEHHPDLFWYGIHGVETLFTIMGPGCVSVTRTQTKDTEFVTGVWSDGRVGTFRGMRAGKHDYGATVFGTKGIAPSGGYGGYEPLLVEIARFFKTGKPPVSAQETLEIVAFMEAADASKRQGGGPIKLDDVRAKAAEALNGR